MKKFFMIAVMAVAAISANAQQPEAGTWTIAPKAGLNVSTLNSEGNSAKAGFVAGIDFGYQATDNFAITAGAVYSQMGAKVKDTSVNQNLDYISVPVLANYYIVKGLAIKAGFQFDFKARDKFSADGESVSWEDFFNGVNAATYGYAGCAGVKAASFGVTIPVGASYEYKGFILDARYNIGLTNVYKDAPSGADAIRTSGFQVTLGYKIAL